MTRKIKTIIFYYFPVIFWMILIFFFSGIPELKSGSSSITLEIFLRKGAHFLEYFVLACLFFRIFFGLKKMRMVASSVWALFLSLIYALTDEFHQSFVPGRSGNFLDILFDFFSALILIQLIFLIQSKKKLFSKSVGFFLTIIVLLSIQIKMIERGRVIEKQKEEEDFISEKISEEIVEEKIILKEEESKSDLTIPAQEIFILVPFTTQAPYAVWDEYHEEACEEASLIMLKYFLDQKKLNPEIAEKEIQALIDFQIKKYGDYRDSTAQELVGLAKDFYGMKNLEVVYDFTKDDLKKYLAEGKPIIIPAAGRLLGNPYFTPPGPLYHNLVLVGYNKNRIITNDPGTRRGEGYTYDIDILYNAIHDFTGKKENIEKGRKAMIVVIR